MLFLVKFNTIFFIKMTQKMALFLSLRYPYVTRVSQIFSHFQEAL